MLIELTPDETQTLQQALFFATLTAKREALKAHADGDAERVNQCEREAAAFCELCHRFSTPAATVELMP